MFYQIQVFIIGLQSNSQQYYVIMFLYQKGKSKRVLKNYTDLQWHLQDRTFPRVVVARR